MQLTNKILKAEKLKNPELKKYELYAIMTILIKEQNHFQNLKDLNKFLNNIDISTNKIEKEERKLILIKAIDIIEKSTAEEVEKILKNIKEEIEKLPIEKNESQEKKQRKNGEEGYINSLLEKYSRN
jgi:hypothetical protein